MRLENLYQNFSNLSPEAQLLQVAEYRLRRSIDMSKEPTWPKPKKTSKTKSKVIKLTPEEETVRKLLGLTKKQIIFMREI